MITDAATTIFRAIAACALLALASSSFAAEPIIGVASVIDGDTIEVHGQRIRLNGIDAPESRQLCLDAAGRRYRCGQTAAFALDDFLAARRPVSCVQIDRDRYGRIVAECTAGGINVEDWLVREGHALDWPRYSKGAYADAEAEARAAKRGMWAGSFQRPWEWRKDHDAPMISTE
ncbi:thermonuclease family protein [Ciceribacter azotifigens]|uniref:thermonuclease family protein n=1 Tax=Ciceribacter azotifigens TaxID=2069303 RepID=UPI003A87A4E5